MGGRYDASKSDHPFGVVSYEKRLLLSCDCSSELLAACFIERGSPAFNDHRGIERGSCPANGLEVHSAHTHRIRLDTRSDPNQHAFVPFQVISARPPRDTELRPGAAARPRRQL